MLQPFFGGRDSIGGNEWGKLAGKPTTNYLPILCCRFGLSNTVQNACSGHWTVKLGVHSKVGFEDGRGCSLIAMQPQTILLWEPQPLFRHLFRQATMVHAFNM